MEGHVFIGNNRSEDVKWLCSLSESELDILISLKKLVLRLAEVVGHESLARAFDVKVLRAIGFILMQHVKGQLKDLQMTEVNLSEEVLDRCNMLKLDQGYCLPYEY